MLHTKKTRSLNSNFLHNVKRKFITDSQFAHSKHLFFRFLSVLIKSHSSSAAPDRWPKFRNLDFEQTEKVFPAFRTHIRIQV